MDYNNKPDLDELVHFGVKGMRWGIRKDRHSSDGDTSGKKRESKTRFTPEQKAMAKKVAIGTGALLLAAGAAAVAYHLNKNGKTPIKSVVETAAKGREATHQALKDPVDIIHATRGKNKGFSFLRTGGIPSYLSEYETAFGADSTTIGVFKRYGPNGQKIAASFVDPEGRRDFAGRIIPHEVIIPSSMSSGINNLDDVKTKIWPLLKDQYDAHYDG